jgi:outer membrane protein assembly factor BamB
MMGLVWIVAVVVSAVVAPLPPWDVPAGLCVQLGARDVQPAIELARTGRFLVRVVEIGADRLETARQLLDAAGVYGLASAGRLTRRDRLPLAENLVNLLLVEPGEDGLPRAEIERVLCPGGVALRLGPRPAVLARKPWPSTIDAWSHPRHGPDGNAVAHDETVGPPRRVRWITGPPFESTGLVSAGGRNFYSGVLARDSFNGLQLWKRSLCGSEADDGSEILIDQKRRKQALPVALGDLLLGVDQGRLVALDAASGAKRREYPAAGTPVHLVALNRRIVTLDAKTVRAFDVDSARPCWTFSASRPRCLAAGDARVFFLHGQPERGEPVVATCLDLERGQIRWQREYPWAPAVRGAVYHDGQLALEVSSLNDNKAGNRIHMLRAADGQPLWEHEFTPGMCHAKQARAMFVGSRVWILDDGDHRRGSCTALDVQSGAVVRNYPAGWGHCFPSVATSQYLFSGEMHLTDLATGAMDVNRISKGACSDWAGFMPANGLIYVTPKVCVCWPMLRENVALAPARAGDRPEDKPLASLDFPLERGVGAPQSPPAESEADWPCYRHDAWRSAGTPTALPDRPTTAWHAELGGWPPRGPIVADWRHDSFVAGPVTAPVIAGGVVYVARPDAHQVVALDANSGAVRWRYRASARVDTAPTIHAGLCLFGVKSGEVVCLRADDGRPMWRLDVAPHQEQIVAYGQLESPWPVPGSVLLVDGVAYFAAGRQPYADGGIRVFAVEPQSGRILWRQRLDSVPQRWFYGDNHAEFDAFDLLHREGDQVAMSRWLFDRATGRISSDPKRGFAHLTTGASGVWVPQGSWSYAPPYETIAHRIRPWRRPLVAFRDNTLYGCTEDKHSLYRRDFPPDEPFDSEWYRSIWWLRSKRPNELWRSQRLAAQAAWNVPVIADPSPQRVVAGMLLARDRVCTVDSTGELTIRSAADGSLIARVATAPPVWDGLAAAHGRLYLSTLAGQVICLAGPR